MLFACVDCVLRACVQHIMYIGVKLFLGIPLFQFLFLSQSLEFIRFVCDWFFILKYFKIGSLNKIVNYPTVNIFERKKIDCYYIELFK